MNAMTYQVRTETAKRMAAKVAGAGDTKAQMDAIDSMVRSMVATLALSYRANGHVVAADRMVAGFATPERGGQSVERYAGTALHLVLSLAERHSRPAEMVIATVNGAIG